MRKQYHFKKSGSGFLAWDVDKLITASTDFPIFEIDLTEIHELYENYWYQDASSIPTCMSIVEHMKLVLDSDLTYPILLAADGSVMDGMHRVCKAHLENRSIIKAVRFPKTPDPDFRDVLPEDLPY